MLSNIGINFKFIKASSLKLKLRKEEFFNLKCGRTMLKTLIKAGATAFVPMMSGLAIGNTEHLYKKEINKFSDH